MTSFFIGFGFIPLSPPPTPPCNVGPQKGLITTQFAQNLTLCGVGGEGSLVLPISLERSQPF